jgi:hypothetical protein
LCFGGGRGSIAEQQSDFCLMVMRDVAMRGVVGHWSSIGVTAAVGDMVGRLNVAIACQRGCSMGVATASCLEVAVVPTKRSRANSEQWKVQDYGRNLN